MSKWFFKSDTGKLDILLEERITPKTAKAAANVLRDARKNAEAQSGEKVKKVSFWQRQK